MDPGFQMIENASWLAVVVGSLLSVPFFAYGGYLYVSSMGDPNRSAAARNSIISVCVGLVVIGCSFIVPAVVGEMVVAPAGGVVHDRDRGVNCDGILRRQLVANSQVSDARRINVVIRRIQSRFEGCDDTLWTPVAREDSGSVPGDCFDTPAMDHIAGVPVPRGLKRGGSVRNQAGRDARGNIIVYWTVGSIQGSPSDGSVCWMYVSPIDTWVEGYYR